MAEPIPFRPPTSDVPADASEREAFEGRRPYEPTYCDFERWEEGGEPPSRSWAVENWLGLGHVTLLAAKGGMGKSVLALQMTTALALGRDFIGKVHQPRTSLVWMGEDDDDELWRRERAICAKFGVSMADLRNRVYLESMAAEDCTLVANLRGNDMVRTSMLTTLREEIGDLKAEVVVLDNIARLFAGNENDRYQVTSFMAALAWAVEPTNAAVLLIGHTAKAVGSEFSGNAAWENAARARLWFSDQKPDQPERPPGDADEPPEDLRYLSKRKMNYTQRDLCVMRYTDGAYDLIQTPDPFGVVASIAKGNAKKKVLSIIVKLGEMGIFPTESTASPNYLPKLAVQYSLADGSTKSELAAALRTLMTDGEVTRKQVGQYANRTPKFGLAINA